MHIIHAVLLLALIGPAAWAYSRGNRLQYVVAWLVIFTALSWGYQMFAPAEGTRFDRMVEARKNYYNRDSNRGGERESDRAVMEDRRPDSAEDYGSRALQPSRSGEDI
ncbi:MAG: hypothetical protein KI792_05275 [Alphaproteobacteria bacterium]|nr:hypothetical protein [Alphaproteobacteria bacterium SS10]